MHRSIIKTIIIIVMCVFVAKFGAAKEWAKFRSDRQRALIMAICSTPDDAAQIALRKLP